MTSDRVCARLRPFPFPGHWGGEDEPPIGPANRHLVAPATLCFQVGCGKELLHGGPAVGHSCRWRPAVLVAGMRRIPVRDGELRPQGNTRCMRTGVHDPQAPCCQRHHEGRRSVLEPPFTPLKLPIAGWSRQSKQNMNQSQELVNVRASRKLVLLERSCT